MASRKPLTDSQGEVRELSAKDAAEAVSFAALPRGEQKVLRDLRRRGPQRMPKKIPVSIRLSTDVAEGLRSAGKGWQRLADQALRSWLKQHKGKSRRRPAAA